MNVKMTREEEEMALLIPKEHQTKDPRWGKRHWVVAVLSLGMAVSYALRVNLSVALVAMVRTQELSEMLNYSSSDTCPDTNRKNSSTFAIGEFNWDPSTQGIILSSFFYGYVTTQFIGGHLTQHFGGKLVLALGNGITALLTLLTPALARADVNLLITARVLEGIMAGVTIPAMYMLLSKWTPAPEKCCSGSIAIAGMSFGSALATPVTGALCQYGFAGGWPSSFYVLGGVGVLWVVVFVIFTTECPENDKGVSSQELKYILETTGSQKKKYTTPWRSIFTSIQVWALITGVLGIDWAFYTFLTMLPSYLKQVLRFDISENGILSALPFMCRACVEVIAGVAADKIIARKLMSTLAVRRAFTALGCFLPSILMIVVGFLGCDHLLVLAVLFLSIAITGLTVCGAEVNIYDIAPAHAGVVMGIANTFAAIPGMVAPSLVEAITETKPLISRWRWVFILSSTIYILGSLVFMIGCSAEEQDWAKPVEEDEEEIIETEKLVNVFSNKEVIQDLRAI